MIVSCDYWFWQSCWETKLMFTITSAKNRKRRERRLSHSEQFLCLPKTRAQSLSSNGGLLVSIASVGASEALFWPPQTPGMCSADKHRSKTFAWISKSKNYFKTKKIDFMGINLRTAVKARMSQIALATMEH